MEGNTKPWDQLRPEFSLHDSLFFKWLQQTPYQVIGKRKLKNCSDTSDNIIYLIHHLIKGNPLINLEKLNSKELQNINRK